MDKNNLEWTKTAYEIVKTARTINRPSTLQCVNAIFTDFIEFHGDRQHRDDEAIVGGIAFLGKMPVTIVGIQKGQNLDENLRRNFGSPHPEGYRKALRLMQQAEKFRRPVVAFINTAGAFCGVSAEERGQGEAIARNLFHMSGLKTPIVSIITGEGGSGGALALGVSDEVWMLQNSIYSILSPEGFASILWRDSTKAAEAAEVMKLTATDLLSLSVIDKIIPEPPNNPEGDFSFTYAILKQQLQTTLEVLCQEDISLLIQKRYERFRKFGEFAE